MQATLALLALAASAVSAQGIAAGTLKPTTATPAGCSQNYNGKFQITIVQAGPAKRDLVEKRQSSCSSSGTLVAQLANGILTDSAGRIGGIVANRQFQFDGPPSQTGTIYNGGWSVCNNGSLAIGGNALFYQCLSGGFYNLYDRNVAAQCQSVLIEVIPCSGTTTGVAVVTQSADGQPAGSSATTRRVTQISDGQLQASSAAPRPVSQFTDGQIQVTASAGPYRAPVSQIGDGQIQATSAATRAPVSQISDGQIQATSAARATTTRAPVSQISDGQIQATSAAPRSTTTSRAPVSQISDGQIQVTSAATRVATTTRAVVSQISDGQVQASSATTRPATYTGAASANKVGGAVLAAGLAAALL